jgi:hypothetical protein
MLNLVFQKVDSLLLQKITFIHSFNFTTMIKILLPVFLFFISFARAQSTQVCFYTLYDGPNKTTMPNMSNNVGLGFSVGYQPTTNIPMYIELDLNHSNNASDNISRSVGFTDGTTKTYYTHYDSRVNKYVIGTKFFTGYEFSPFKFFITPQLGVLNFNTKIDYPDLYHYQDNTTEFKRITKKFQHSNCSFYGAQIGVEIHLKNLLKKATRNDNRIQLSVNMIQSFSSFKYINLNKTQAYTDASKELGIDQLVFPNNETIDNPIYAENYNTKLNMWGFHIGYIFTIGNATE